LTYKLAAGFLLAALFIAVLDNIANVDSTIDSTDAAVVVVNTAFGVEEVELDEATLGDSGSSGVIATTFSAPKVVAGWVGSLASALTFNASFFKGDFQFIRLILVTISGPVMLIVSLQLMGILFGSLRGLFGR
jgi:hypothetical protein